MPEPTQDPNAQHSIEMPDGVVLSGVGGDAEALRIHFEERAEERADAQQPTPTEPAAAKSQAAVEGHKTRGQKRFDKLTAEAAEATRRADAAEARAKELETKLAAAPTVAPVATQPVAEPTQPVAPVAATPTRPKPSEAEVGEKYQTYSDFVEDLADWKAEQRELKLVATLDARSTARIEADRATRNRTEYVNGTVFPAGRAAYPDFDAVLKANQRPVSPLHHEAILKLPHPEHVLYALCKDDAKLEKISAITDPIQLGIELAQLIPRESVAPPASTAPVVRTTNVPPPIQPVGASTRTTSPTIEELAKAGEYEAYKAARAAARRA